MSGINVSIYQILTVVLPMISSAVTWLLTKRKRNNNFISELQGSIDLLSEKYTEALDQLTIIRAENLELRTLQREMTNEIEDLKLKNNQLRKNIEYLKTKLDEAAK